MQTQPRRSTEIDDRGSDNRESDSSELYAGKPDESGATRKSENASGVAAVAKSYGEPTDNQQGRIRRID